MFSGTGTAARRWRPLPWIGASIIGAMLSGVTGANAADMAVTPDFTIADPEPAGGWEYQFTPYGWFMSISGEASVRGNSLDVSVTFFDIVENSDWLIPLMGYFEASNGRWTLFTDTLYTETRFTNSNSFRRNVLRDTALTLDSKSGLTQTIAFAEVGAGYEVGRWQNEAMGTTTLDVLAGARYWYTEADLSLKVKGSVDFERLGLKKKGKYAIARTNDTEWIDPVVGMRVKQEIAPGKVINLLGDIGGFGVGSEFTWQLFAGYSSEFHVGRVTWAGTIGYRAIGVNYDGKHGNELDYVLHGPIAGLTARW